ncbi:MAG: hypothetical protein ACRDDY_13865 [Clostridium sp.]|uniref:hypothetical protein n=1 Tax=Clostridium sp. TaxID=1506 RepID=UPI003EE55585
MRNIPNQKRSRARVDHVKAVANEYFKYITPASVDAGSLAAAAGVTRTSLYRYFYDIDVIAVELWKDAEKEVSNKINSQIAPVTIEAYMGAISATLSNLPSIVLDMAERMPLNTGGFDDAVVKWHITCPSLSFETFRTAVRIAARIGSDASIAFVRGSK